MEISLFLARFWGFYFIIVALIYLFRRKSLNLLIESMENKGISIVFGFFTLLIGLIMVLIHNLWVNDWRVILTIFGWSALLKGIMLLGWPETVKKHSKKMIDKYYWLCFVLFLLVGGYLVYLSYSV